MIVSPDFTDHWKVAMLVQMTDASAGFCVLRFWAHCQNRRTWRFKNMTPQVLAAVCKWTGDPQKLWDAMIQTFIDIEGEEVVAHEWDEYNAALIAAWERGQYGKLGGRNRKAGRRKAKTSMGASMGALEEPDKSREDKSRVEGIRGEKNGEDGEDILPGLNGSDAKEVLEFLNKTAGTAYRNVDTNLNLIRSRMEEHEATVEDMKQMIQRQTALWKMKGNGMEAYLRPETLFGKTKFAGYFGQRHLTVRDRSNEP